MIKPPFNKETIRLFEKYQSTLHVHPYTCGECSSNLKIRENELYCPNCNYKQTFLTTLPSDEMLDKNPLDSLFKK